MSSSRNTIGRDAGGDCRRRADHQISKHLRKADRFRVYAAGPTSYRANDIDVAVERRSAATRSAHEGRCPYPRSESADVAHDGLRGLLHESGRERPRIAMKLVGSMVVVGLLAIAGL